MPAILHAIVDGVAAAHASGIIHCDLHPFNIMLDFTRTEQPRVGIIDWGVMLRTPSKRPAKNFVRNASANPMAVVDAENAAKTEFVKRPWLAPEMYNPYCADAYTKASDIYALGFVFQMAVDFWVAARKLWMEDKGLYHPAQENMTWILSKVSTWMKVEEEESRRNAVEILLFFKEQLKTDPNLIQRPLVELTPAFYPM